MKRITLCAAIIQYTSASHARAAVYINIYGTLFHYNIKCNYDKASSGEGFSTGLPNTPEKIEAGVSKNSFEDPARLLGLKYDLLTTNNVSIGVNALQWATNKDTHKRPPLTLYGHGETNYNKHSNKVVRVRIHGIAMSLKILLTKFLKN